MALRALLLSPDDQAVNAITGVLDEMSVSCQRPMDGVTAAKKLSSERFDLVLVDCENLPAAKLIFDVCRRSHGAASVPVAIVDGRVGLPTAFRLGAELILTKPVAKDQARITIRTAVSRVKKEQPVVDSKAVGAVHDVEAVHHDNDDSAKPKMHAQAAATGSVSSVISGASVATVSTATGSVAAPAASTGAASTATKAVPNALVTSAATAEVAATSASPTPTTQPAMSPADLLKPSRNASVTETQKPAIAAAPKVSADPVVAASGNDRLTLGSPTFLSIEQAHEKRGRGLLVATLMLVAVAAGGYAAFMYQPAFREFVQLRVEQAKNLLGLQDHPVAGRIRQTVPSAPAKAPVPAKASAPQEVPAPGQPVSTAPANSVTTSANTTSSAVVASAPPATDGAAANSTDAEAQKKIVAPAATIDLPGVKNAVILSSKGAEKRLVHRVAPVVPVAARSQSDEATVVLKVLVDESGVVKKVVPVEGSSALSDAAVKAVKQWRYKPYTRDGKGFPFQTIVLVDLQ